MKKKILFLVVLSIILLTSFKCDTNQDEKVRIFVAWPGASYLPSYEWKIGESKPIGVEPVLIERIFELIDTEYVFVNDYNYLKDDDVRIDVIIDGYADVSIRSITITEERKEKVSFSKPYYIDGISAMVINTSGINKKADLKNKTVYADKFTTAYEWAKKNLPNSKIVSRGDFKINVLPENLLLQNEIDVYLADKTYLTHIASKNDKFKVFKEKFTNELFGIAMAKYNDKLLNKINSAIEQLEKSGELEQLTARFEK